MIITCPQVKAEQVKCILKESVDTVLFLTLCVGHNNLLKMFLWLNHKNATTNVSKLTLK